MKFVTADPRSGGLSAAVGSTVFFVDSGVRSALVKVDTGATDWVAITNIAALSPADLRSTPAVPTDPRSGGRTAAEGSVVLYHTGGDGTYLQKYGSGATDWCEFPSAGGGTPGPTGPAGADGADGADGATGPAGPAPSGTGFVHVTGGVLNTPAELTGDVTAGATGVTAIGANKVLDTMIRQSAALSVVGRSANTVGNVADIVAGTDGYVLKRSGTAIGFAAEQDLTGIGLGFFGTGIDGDVTLDGTSSILGMSTGTTTWHGVTRNFHAMTRDLYLNDVTINAGVLLFTNGWRVFIKGTLTWGSSTSALGFSGNDGSAGTQAAGGAGAAARSSQLLGGSGAGGNGGTPGPGTGTAGGGGASNPSVPEFSNTVGVAGKGGLGGNSSGGGVGGLGGVVTPSAANLGGMHEVITAVRGAGIPGTRFIGGSGGGGGRGSDVGANRGGGGGGGAGGGVAVLCAREITGAGSVLAFGGHGGSAFTTPTNNEGGGGAGGGGGAAVIVIGTGSFPTVDVTGGTGGARGGAGSTTAGADGAPGISYLFRIGA